jgi:D-glycero-alpha-D-manno-heptose 1-phosphate guanylyltransferase
MKSMPQEALIIAGGLGTRLRPVVNDLPKPMADVLGKPFLSYLVDYWIAQGIMRFVLAIGYKGECIRDYFGDSYKVAKIDYIEEEEPLGTGGAVKQALENVNWQGDKIVLLNGDTWFEANVLTMCRCAQKHAAPITMTLKTVENNDRYGGVQIDDTGKVTDFTTEKGGKTLINTGCYILNVVQLKSLLVSYPLRFSIEEDVLRPFAKKGLLAASVQEKIFLDIGLPESYSQAAQIFKDS